MENNNLIQDLRTYMKKGAVTIFTAYVIISCLGFIIDLFVFFDSNKLIYFNNLLAFSLTIIFYFIYRFRKISLKTSFAFILYAGLANVLIGTFADPYSVNRINFFMRDSLFIVFLITFAALIVDKRHAIRITVLYSIAAITLAFVRKDEFLLSSLFLIILFLFAYTLVMYYFVGVVDKSIEERERNSHLLNEQNKKVNDANLLLKQRQLQIEKQTEELNAQAASLQEQAELLVKKNEELKNLNMTKDKFISILAHDLKNPFNIVLGFSQILKEEYKSLNEEEKNTYITAIHSTSRKTYTLLENLLQWILSQSNSIQLNKRRINVGMLVRENLNLIRESALNKSIKIIENISKNCYSDADEQMINTVIRNLISNAVKFTSIGGKIGATIKNDKTMIVIEISDNGIGMDEETQNSLFKIDKTRSRKGTSDEMGTGLGLILCKDFVEKNGGKLWFESEENMGTTFYFTLPTAEN